VTDRPLHGMFSAVPPSYDLVNRVATLGLDAGWRRAAAAACLDGGPARVLDLCTGTGDLAVEIARRAGPETRVTGLDFSAPMLERARAKASAAGVDVTFLEGDAASLPFPDFSFDAVGISFGFRNLVFRNPNADRHLSEIVRVLSPGGRFVVVESSQPDAAFVRPFFHVFVGSWVRLTGIVISGNRGAYAYLAETVRRFPDRAGVRDLLLGAGFASVTSRPLFLGAAALHVALR
jgi:demethylmenaquinone methyltransferase / 2-methoxy-6-polyprenyl-1,4-benzoquinol methylase